MYDDNLFSNIDFGPLKEFLDNDDITDISYSNNGQLWLKCRAILGFQMKDIFCQIL